MRQARYHWKPTVRTNGFNRASKDANEPPLRKDRESDDDAHSLAIARRPEQRGPRYVASSLLLHFESVADLRHFENDEWITVITAVGMKTSENACSLSFLYN